MITSSNTSFFDDVSSIWWKTSNFSKFAEVYYNISLETLTPRTFISLHKLRIFQWVCYASICPFMGLFGMTTNIINIICFIKQGFKDAVNISLLGLAVSDFGCLLTLVWLSVALVPIFQEADLPFSALEIDYLTGGWPHVAFTSITSCITAFITLERCLCIIVPLKVKAIITQKRSAIAIVCIFIALIVSISPAYCVNSFGMKFYAKLNKSMLGLVYSKDKESVEKITFAINNVFLPFVTFTLIWICTVVLVVTLQRKAAWRKKSMTIGHADTVSRRDRKIAKMVVFISGLFIACFTPLCLIFVGMILEPGLSVGGKYENLFLMIAGLGFLLESTNSSMNIFIYYHMSSKYRVVFRKLFCMLS